MNLMCRWITLGLMGGSLVAGCHKAPPPPPPPPPVVWHAPDDRESQVVEFNERTIAVNQSITDLSGQSREQHQHSAAEIFDQLSKILQVAQGSNTPPEFINRIGVVNQTQAVLAQSDMTSSRAEASENDGLRAALQILRVLATRDASSNTVLAQALSDADAKVAAMFTITGAMHDIAANQAYAAVGRVLNALRAAYK